MEPGSFEEKRIEGVEVFVKLAISSSSLSFGDAVSTWKEVSEITELSWPVGSFN